MKIEAGKFYRTRGGEKVGPMELEDDGDFMAEHPLQKCTVSWRPNGSRYLPDPNCDLIAEWTDEPEYPNFETRRDFVEHFGETTDNPKTWAEMTDAERKNISFDAMCGKEIELGGDFGWQSWDKTTPLCETHQPIRIKPEPKRETVTCWWGAWGFTLGNQSCRDTHRITFDIIDGKPDLGSIKMEEVQ